MNDFFDFNYSLNDYKLFSYLQSLYFVDIKMYFSFDPKIINNFSELFNLKL